MFASRLDAASTARSAIFGGPTTETGPRLRGCLNSNSLQTERSNGVNFERAQWPWLHQVPKLVVRAVFRNRDNGLHSAAVVRVPGGPGRVARTLHRGRHGWNLRCR